MLNGVTATVKNLCACVVPHPPAVSWIAMHARLLVIALLFTCSDGLQRQWRGKGRGKGSGKGGGGGVSSGGASPPPVDHNFDTVDCPKCMSAVMRLLVVHERGCPASNATVVTSTDVHRVPTAYCPTLLPKKRACVAYSFGLDGTWDFDKVCATPTDAKPWKVARA